MKISDYEEVLDQARRLSLLDQVRLLEELAYLFDLASRHGLSIMCWNLKE
jgi:uncharacterized protein (DUF488 family)